MQLLLSLSKKSLITQIFFRFYHVEFSVDYEEVSERQDLVETGVDVVGELDLCDRSQAVESHADRRSDDAAFRNRRVDDAVQTMR